MAETGQTGMEIADKAGVPNGIIAGLLMKGNIDMTISNLVAISLATGYVPTFHFDEQEQERQKESVS